MKSKEEFVGEINYKEFDSYLNKEVFTVKEIIASKPTWHEVFNTLYTYMKQGFEQEKVRKHPVKFRFNDTDFH